MNKSIKYYYKLLVIIIITLMSAILLKFYGCSDAAMPVYDGRFGIYMLKDSMIKYDQVIKMNFEDVELQETPWLPDRLIERYDFSSHCIYLKVDKSQFFHEHNYFFNLWSWDSRPFAVVANGKLCFWGCLHWTGHCNRPAVIGSENMGIPPKDILCITNSAFWSKDVRNNDYFKKILIESNKYSGGLEITMDSIIIIKTGDTSIVKYTITIKNIDSENLYIYDYDSTAINKYSNDLCLGVRFYNKTNNVSTNTSANYVGPGFGTYYILDNKLFLKLESGDSIKRKFISYIKYKFTYGNYYCCFEYKGAGVEKKERELYDGRKWMGPARSNILDITFDKDNNCRINNRNVNFK